MATTGRHAAPARRGKRRSGGLFMTLSIAAALGIGITIAGSANAVETPGGQTPAPVSAEDAAGKLKQAYDIALAAAKRCPVLLRGPSGEGFDVLEAVYTADPSRVRLHPDQVKLTPTGHPILAEALVNAGTAGTIDVYQTFYDETVAPENFGTTEAAKQLFEEYGGQPTIEEFRAVILLHETSHLTGKNNHGDDYGEVQDLNRDIFRLCVRSGAASGGGGGLGNVGGPGLSTDGGRQIVVTDLPPAQPPQDNPETDVNIGEITDWDVDPQEECEYEPIGCDTYGDFGGRGGFGAYQP
jgi:hypothetical protein